MEVVKDSHVVVLNAGKKVMCPETAQSKEHSKGFAETLPIKRRQKM